MKKLICLVLLLGGQAGAGYIPDMPYFHQYSNRLNPSGSCQNTCIAIVLKYYGADDITPDKISAKWGTYIAQTTGGLEKIFNAEADCAGCRSATWRPMPVRCANCTVCSTPVGR